VAAAAVGVLALGISVGWLVLGWVREGSAVAAPRAGMLSAVLAAVVAGVGLMGWVRQRGSGGAGGGHVG
jgi:hypothetical protein